MGQNLGPRIWVAATTIPGTPSSPGAFLEEGACRAGRLDKDLGPQEWPQPSSLPFLVSPRGGASKRERFSEGPGRDMTEKTGYEGRPVLKDGHGQAGMREGPVLWASLYTHTAGGAWQRAERPILGRAS